MQNRLKFAANLAAANIRPTSANVDIFTKAYNFAQAALYAQNKLAKDDAQWVTVKPNGAEHKGRHVMIDRESGTVLAGMGGKFNGQHISKAKSASQTTASNSSKGKTKRSKNPTTGNFQNSSTAPQAASNNQSVNTPESEALHKQIADLQRQLAQAQQALQLQVQKASKPPEIKGQKPQINLDLPDKISKDTVLQNRSRANVASVQQMENIARNLDYYLVGTSNDFNSGCPVVSFGKYDDKAFGNKEILVTPDNKHLNVQYAVIDAGQVNTSHSAHGDTNEKYFSQDPNLTRAVAGNGRMAAIQLAYSNNNEAAAAYKKALIDNANKHGCDPERIKGMSNPVLVRVMQPKDVTEDIGDKTNITQGLQLNAVEQSKTDEQRIKNQRLEFETYEDGSPKIESVKKFIASLPRNEQAALVTASGEPSRQAQDRLQNALMMAGYGSEYLVKLRGQAIDPDGKNILTALSNAASGFSKLNGAGEYDVRNVINSVVEGFSKYTNMGSGKDFRWQADMMESPEFNQRAKDIAELVNANKRSSAKLTVIFKSIATHMANAYDEKTRLSSGGTLFGLEDLDMTKEYKSPSQAFKEALDFARWELDRRDSNKLSKSNPGSSGLMFNL